MTQCSPWQHYTSENSRPKGIYH